MYRAGSLLVLVSALQAQVFTVDASGSGAHFTDLPTAVAAVPDGSTLRVRAGSYSPFTVQGKGIRILGEGTVTLQRGSGDVVVTGTNTRQVVLLRNLSLEDVGKVTIGQCSGPVLLESCSATLRAPIVVVSQSTNVQFLRCTISGGLPLLSPAYRMMVTTSSVFIAGCVIGGSNASRRCSGTSFAIGCGQHGVGLVGSSAVVIASRLTGGSGSPGACLCFHCLGFDGGDGGDGCDLQDSTLYAFMSTIVGGAGGAGSPGQNCLYCTCYPTLPGFDGQPFRHLGNSTFRSFWNGAIAEVVGEQATGSQAAFAVTVNGVPPFTAAMVFAYQGDLMPLASSLGYGMVLAAPVGFLGPFTMNTPSLQLQWTVPAGLQPGFVYFGQFAVLGSSGLSVSNPFSFVVAR